MFDVFNKSHHVAHNRDIAKVKNVRSPNQTPIELAAKYISTCEIDNAACSLKGDKISHDSLNNCKRSMELDE